MFIITIKIIKKVHIFLRIANEEKLKIQPSDIKRKWILENTIKFKNRQEFKQRERNR